jgi:hypothetical protein
MDGIPVLDGDIVTPPLRTDVIQIPKAPIIRTSAETLPVSTSSDKTANVVVSIVTLNEVDLLIGINSTVSCSSIN